MGRVPMEREAVCRIPYTVYRRTDYGRQHVFCLLLVFTSSHPHIRVLLPSDRHTAWRNAQMNEEHEPQLTHLDAQGHAHMVDVGAKAETQREALARAVVLMQPETLRLIIEGGLPKGDVLAVARVAGIMAAKRTPDLIPLCHSLLLTHVAVVLTPDADRGALAIEATVRTRGQTGVEMEALTAVSVAALTVYDMCKAVDRGMRITDIRLAQKRGGRSGEILLEA